MEVRTIVIIREERHLAIKLKREVSLSLSPSQPRPVPPCHQDPMLCSLASPRINYEHPRFDPSLLPALPASLPSIKLCVSSQSRIVPLIAAYTFKQYLCQRVVFLAVTVKRCNHGSHLVETNEGVVVKQGCCEHGDNFGSEGANYARLAEERLNQEEEGGDLKEHRGTSSAGDTG
ncbi:hypothetical protein O3P69_003188 [Scylla paramamosain]|uniref:Uncharacterized protein n=1 Tax=Scylla paramamosain TaxID=85552 RepID=A0AAW0ULE6_SCYPA